MEPWDKAEGEGLMGPQRLAVSAVLCGTLVLIGWVAVGPTDLGSAGIENGGAPIDVQASRATAMAGDGIDGASVPDTGIVAALPDPDEVSPALPVRMSRRQRARAKPPR